jgi:predicted SAM-dependent methyltransferase
VPSPMNLINIGCGSVIHSSWKNLDLVPASIDVESCDFRKGIPYPDIFFDACYSSHVLEHLKPQNARNLLSECYRILKSNGIIRIVVPDLETIARTYLLSLEQAEAGIVEAIPNYDWIMLELYDQIVRSHTGGEMQAYLSQSHIPNETFIKSRIGLEYDSFLQKQSENKNRDLISKIKSQNLSKISKNKNFLDRSNNYTYCRTSCSEFFSRRFVSGIRRKSSMDV